MLSTQLSALFWQLFRKPEPCLSQIRHFLTPTCAGVHNLHSPQCGRQGTPRAPWEHAPSLTVALLLPRVALLAGVLLLGVRLLLGRTLLVPSLLLAVLGVPCGKREHSSPADQ